MTVESEKLNNKTGVVISSEARNPLNPQIADSRDFSLHSK